jgi:hypothetical protein
LGELLALSLILFAALEDFKGLLAQSISARAIAHFRETGLVGGEFSVESGELYINAGDT